MASLWGYGTQFYTITALYSLQVIGLIVGSSVMADRSLDPVGQRRCSKPVPIQIPECKNTFYNFTGMPNLVEQETQFDARHQLQTFKPLITYRCSSKLNFFLCSVYTPMCDVNTRHLIGPCRPLCEHVRARCAPVLRVFDFDWPANLNCSRFPLKNSVDGAMCMEGPDDAEESIIAPQTYETDSKKPSDAAEGDLSSENAGSESRLVHYSVPEDNTITFHLEDGPNLVSKLISKLETPQNGIGQDPVSNVGQPSSISLLAQSLRYCAHLKKPTFYVHVNRTGRCVPLCKADILFTAEAKTLSTVWTSILTGICSLITTFTLIGYAMDSNVLWISERPIIYIALCQLFYSLGYALSLGLGREAVTCGRDLDSGREIRLQEGLDNSVCALIFMVQYFFFIAGSIWWVLLALHWAVQISRHWSHDTFAPPLLDDAVGHRIDSEPAPTANASESGCWFKLCEFCPCSIKPEYCEKQYVWSNGHAAADFRTDPSRTCTLPSVGNVGSCAEGYNTHSCSTHRAGSAEATFYCLQNGKIIPSNAYASWFNHRYDIVAHNKLSMCLAREHVIVWLTSGLLTVAVLVSRQVDADELIPVCGVGRQRIRAMGTFVIGPQLTLFVCGVAALLAGLATYIRYRWNRTRLVVASASAAKISTSLSRPTEPPQTSDSSRLIPHNPKNQFGGTAATTALKSTSVNPRPSNIDGPTLVNCYLEQHSFTSSTEAHRARAKGVRFYHSGSYPTPIDFLQLRMGLFCLLYLLPAACVVSCDLYEFLSRDTWLRDPSYKKTEESIALKFPPKLWKPNEVVGPNPEVFMLRIFMSLVPGFTCSLWIISVKGCKPWRRMFQNIWSRMRQCGVNRHRKSNRDDEHKCKQLGKQVTSVVCNEKLTRKTEIFPVIPQTHPYAVYQYANGGPNRTAQSQNDTSEGVQNRIQAGNSAQHSAACEGWNANPFVIEPVNRLSTEGLELQQSSATTPGYYSHAKLGSVLEPHLSDTFSEGSTVPPPLPTTDRPHLPARGDPCIGASNTQVSALGVPQKQPQSHTNVTAATTGVNRFPGRFVSVVPP
ncbi:unnamed protein product [Calicophoron daubneyi]|uniref:FZ domain-containing protein n=1 Tax=Calicophoron daubneyi TaxID=300641 RepID=A0AAV2T875_CALDB